MQVIISKINKVLYQGEATSLSVPGTEGEMTILPHHAPLVSLLRKGEVKVASAEGEKTFSIEKGFVETAQNKVTVLL